MVFFLLLLRIIFKTYVAFESFHSLHFEEGVIWEK